MIRKIIHIDDERTARQRLLPWVISLEQTAAHPPARTPKYYLDKSNYGISKSF